MGSLKREDKPVKTDNHLKHESNLEEVVFEKVSLSKSESSRKNGEIATKSIPNDRTRVRFYICTFSLLALTTSQMSRMALNQSITVMVDPSMTSTGKLVTNLTSTTTPRTTTIDPIETTSSETSSIRYSALPESPTAEAFIQTSTSSEGSLEDRIKTTTYASVSSTGEYVDQAATTTSRVFKQERADEEQAKSTTTISPVVEDDSMKNIAENRETFKWNTDDRSTLLGGFYYGYFLFMVPGGRIAEAYGSKYVLLASVAGSAVINLATPWMARNSFQLLLIARVALGAIQAGVIPGLYALFNEWLTISETSIYAPLVKMNLRLGMMLGSLLCGYSGYHWTKTFYATGIICAVWSILWIILATSNPKDNRWVSKAELQHINKKKKKQQPAKSIEDGRDIELKERDISAKGKKEEKEDESTPWLRIFTAPSVIGLIMVKLVFNYSIDFLVILLPSYLADVHQASPRTVTSITMPIFAVQTGLVVFVGWLAKYTVQKKPFNLSKTAIRKIFQTICNGGMALAMLALTFNNYNLLYVTVCLHLVSIPSMFTAGGDTVLPYDLSEKYPATIMAIANCIGNISGVTTLEIARQVLRGQPDSYDQWNKLIYLVAGGNVIGLLGFITLVKAEPIDFSKKKTEKMRIDAETATDVREEISNGSRPLDSRRDDVERKEPEGTKSVVEKTNEENK